MKMAIAPINAPQHWSFKKFSQLRCFHQKVPSISADNKHWTKQLLHPNIIMNVVCSDFANTTYNV